MFKQDTTNPSRPQKSGWVLSLKGNLMRGPPLVLHLVSWQSSKKSSSVLSPKVCVPIFSERRKTITLSRGYMGETEEGGEEYQVV